MVVFRITQYYIFYYFSKILKTKNDTVSKKKNLYTNKKRIKKKFDINWKDREGQEKDH